MTLFNEKENLAISNCNNYTFLFNLGRIDQAYITKKKKKKGTINLSGYKAHFQ